MFFSNNTKQLIEKLKEAESKLLVLAQNFGLLPDAVKIDTFDTEISSPNKIPGNKHHIHAIRIINENLLQQQQQQVAEAPLVLIHGYMNGAAYFYRNFGGLSRYFSRIYSLDWYGAGLSSRPKLAQKDIHESVFVDSLEQWRKENGIDKMILAGHSMGGYLGVAYCEKHPERVERLILISPVGVPEESEAIKTQRKQSSSSSSFSTMLRRWLYETAFGLGGTPGLIIRTVGGRGHLEKYVAARLPCITDKDGERDAVTDYLYANASLPPSFGEMCANRFLTPYAFARSPLVHRIPSLSFSNNNNDNNGITMLYGANDWMDSKGGLRIQQKTPSTRVLEVRDAGHLLMLENWKEFNAGIVQAVFGEDTELPEGWSTPTPVSPERADHGPVGLSNNAPPPPSPTL